ncbi:hypothetical protein [Thalassoglobus sp.]|uniref:hypothetical protein n=1 Tax=Thalassoglobus sp. TaxID=2795869 RepID=UPI003AA88BEB
MIHRIAVRHEADPYTNSKDALGLTIPSTPLGQLETPVVPRDLEVLLAFYGGSLTVSSAPDRHLSEAVSLWYDGETPNR